MKITVYNELNQVAYEGDAQSAYEWIVGQGEEYNGIRLYRFWQEDGYSYYDVGPVYHTRETLPIAQDRHVDRVIDMEPTR